MRFNRLSITNMRLVGNEAMEIDLQQDKNVVILLGDNGYGKTTVLDAMACAMAPYPAQFPGISDFQLSDMDVHIDNDGKRAGYLTINAELEDQGNVMSSVRHRKGIGTPPKSNYEQVKSSALKAKEAVSAGDQEVALPIFAYYGTGRGQFSVPARKRGFAQTFERRDCYKNALTPATDFKRFFGWFDLMEDEERRERERLKNWDYRLPMLETVRRALTQFVPSFQNPRIEVRPLRFVMDRTDANGGTQELRIEQMSDGYKIVIAMVADLAARMAEANPYMTDPLKSDGIVLIDEIDLHLHPQWQREILTQLHSTFPNIQFIVSTHSPVIVVGAATIAQVVNLNAGTLPPAKQNVENESVGQILLSDLFGLPSLHSPVWDDKINRRDSLLAKSTLSPDETKELAALDRDLSALSSIASPEAIHCNMLLDKIATQLGVTV